MEYDISSAENITFQLLDQFYNLFFPNKLLEKAMDLSKNEWLSLILAYRHGEVNMTEIAVYIQAPLNTTTGVVGRLEKKKLLSRQRSEQDKRVVTVVMTPKGKEVVRQIFHEIDKKYQKALHALTAEEIQDIFQMIDKVVAAIGEDEHQGKRTKTIAIE